MAYNEHLSERVARLLQEKKISFEEKKMFGGMALEFNPLAKSSKA